MKLPKFTDGHRMPLPYSNAAETAKPGYLARKFKAIERALKDQAETKAAEAAAAEAQAKADAEEAARKVTKIKGRKA